MGDQEEKEAASSRRRARGWKKVKGKMVAKAARIMSNFIEPSPDVALACPCRTALLQQRRRGG